METNSPPVLLLLSSSLMLDMIASITTIPGAPMKSRLPKCTLHPSQTPAGDPSSLGGGRGESASSFVPLLTVKITADDIIRSRRKRESPRRTPSLQSLDTPGSHSKPVSSPPPPGREAHRPHGGSQERSLVQASRSQSLWKPDGRPLAAPLGTDNRKGRAGALALARPAPSLLVGLRLWPPTHSSSPGPLFKEVAGVVTGSCPGGRLLLIPFSRNFQNGRNRSLQRGLRHAPDRARAQPTAPAPPRGSGPVTDLSICS